jgi:hypothetical protein
MTNAFLFACIGLVHVPTALAKAPLLEDNTAILDVPGNHHVLLGWKDSYSVGDSCYCATTFDHAIGPVEVDTPLGTMTIKEVCKLLGPGPGQGNHPIYNDIQCGNGPANDAGDETTCPGRVDHGPDGCKYIGPKWNFEPFLENPSAQVPVDKSGSTMQEPIAVSPPDGKTDEGKKQMGMNKRK